MGGLLQILKILVAAGLITWLVLSGRLDFSLLGGHLVNLVSLGGVALIAANFVLAALRWHWLLGLQGGGFSYLRVLRWSWIGEFFAIVSPGSAGADLARGYYALANAPGARTGALSSILLDRLIGLWSMLLLALVSFALLLMGDTPPPPAVRAIGWVSAAGFLGLCLGFAGLASATLQGVALRLAPRRLIQPLEAMFQAYMAGKPVLARAAGLSVLAHLFLLAPFGLAGVALGIDLGWQAVFLVVPLIFIANMVPLSPGGIGIGETAAAFLFAQFGIGDGAAVMMVVRIWLVVVQMIGGAIYLVHGDKPKRPHPEAIPFERKTY